MCPRFTAPITSSSLVKSPVGSSVSDLQGGDIITFAITVINLGTSDVFGLALSDEIPFGLSIPSSGLDFCIRRGDGTTVDYKGSLFNTSGMILMDTDDTQGLKLFGSELYGDLNLYHHYPGVLLASNSKGSDVLIISYDLMVDPILIETGNVTSGLARILSYGNRPAGVNYVSALNLNSDSELLSQPTITIDNPYFTFSLVSTDGIEQDVKSLTIGERATFQLNVTFPVGQTDHTQLVITMPSSGGSPLIAINDSLIVSVGANLEVSSFTGSVQSEGKSITWQIGKVSQPTTPGGSTQSSPSSIIVQATGIVTNQAINGQQQQVLGDIFYELKGDQQTNQSVTVTITEPALQIVASANPSVGAYGGDTIAYRVVISHLPTSASPAFNLSVVDTLSSALSLSSSVNSSDSSTLFHSSSYLNASLDSLPLGQSLELTYLAMIQYPAYFIGNPVITTPALTYLSVPFANPLYVRSNSSSASVTVAGEQPTVLTSIKSTSLSSTSDPFVAIGEQITYWTNVTLPRGTTYLNVTLNLPQSAGKGYVQYLTSRVISVGGISNSSPPQAVITSAGSMGQLVSWNFGLIDNAIEDSVVVLEVVGLVNDSSYNPEGQSLLVTATITYAGGSISLSKPAQATATSPTEYVTGSGLGALTKTSNASTAQGSDTIAFSVLMRYGYGSQPGPIYNLTVQDDLSPGLNLVVGSVTLQYFASDSNAHIIHGNNLGDSTILIQVDEPNGLPSSGGYFGFTYLAIIAKSTPPGSTLVNNASLQWFSAPGGTSVARTYSQTVSTSITTLSPIISIAVIGSSIPQVALNDLSVGETVNLRSTIILPWCSTRLVANISLIGNSGAAILGWLSGMEQVHVNQSIVSVSTNQTASYDLALFDTNVDGYFDTGSFDFGFVQSSGRNSSILIDISAVVENLNANVNTATSNPQLTVLNSKDLQTASTMLNIVEPKLAIAINANTTTVQAGSYIRFTLLVTHTGPSDAPAYNLTISDQLLPQLDLIPSSVAASTGTIAFGSYGSATSIQVSVPSLALGSSLSIGITRAFPFLYRYCIA